MALPADFSKIFGSTATGGLTPIGDVNYAKGWEFVGSNPPTKNDFSYLQHVSDLKSQYLYKVIGGDSGAPAIGIPFFWPLAAMPNTVMDEWSDMVFLKPNGASFSAAEYPKLAKVWTGLVIPEMRGEFLRIWDDGRGVDAGRALLSAQLDALQNITGSFSAATAGAAQLSVLINGAVGAFYPGNQTTSPPNAQATTGNDRVSTMYFDAGRVARTSTETRSRNIAFNFLVRAK